MADDFVLGTWVVTAGDIPGVPMRKLQRQWSYTLTDRQADIQAYEDSTEHGDPEPESTILSDTAAAAAAYYFEMCLSHVWADVKFTRVSPIFHKSWRE